MQTLSKLQNNKYSSLFHIGEFLSCDICKNCFYCSCEFLLQVKSPETPDSDDNTEVNQRSIFGLNAVAVCRILLGVTVEVH